MRDDGFKSSFRGEGPDVELIDDVIFQRKAKPARIIPGKRGVNNSGWTMDAAGLKSRSRVGTLFVVVQSIKVIRPRCNVFDFSLEISLPRVEQRNDLLLRRDGLKFDRRSEGCPDAKEAATRV